MQALSDTVARLAAARRAAEAISTAPVASAPHLREVTRFGSNPGNLRGWLHLPAGLPRGAPLVVALHGCTQSAADYDRGTGWSELANRWGFAVLLPEQQRSNNPNLCFNWFSPIDIGRFGGEALSIRQMVGAVVDGNDLDPRRVFVTGLSAGGAMTAVMLAAFPEIFAAGAIIGGLPYGCANTVPEAFERMAGNLPAAAVLETLVRGASPYAGTRPPVSIWHGTADGTVKPANADALVRQWSAVIGTGAEPSLQESDDRRVRRVWHDAEGAIVLEDIRIRGMAHGVPISSGGSAPVGRSGPYILDVGISSTHHIADGWGLGTVQREAATARRISVDDHPVPTPSEEAEHPAAHGIKATIERALKAAGLM